MSLEDLSLYLFLCKLREHASSTLTQLENEIRRILVLESANKARVDRIVLRNRVPLLIQCIELSFDGTDHDDDDRDWIHKVVTASTTILYEICRVQKLASTELSLFNENFIAHLFILVERTRDSRDETFNYSLIRLIIALNEQFMVSCLPPPKSRDYSGLAPPIIPTAVGQARKDQQRNLVLEVLKQTGGESKTFGENIIFILNRANDSSDALCVSLLILKILYLLFTTIDTQEYFYTNDLCVLVDVFIRELCDLGDESEGLKHTYLRVLHPLLTNTQLRNHPYKRPQLRRVLTSLISCSQYRDVDSTTRRLVERNLKGRWCEGLAVDSIGEGERRNIPPSRKGSATEVTSEPERRGTGWSSGMGRSTSAEIPSAANGFPAYSDGAGLERSISDSSPARYGSLGMSGSSGSTMSVDVIAQTSEVGYGKRRSNTLQSVSSHHSSDSLAVPSSSSSLPSYRNTIQSIDDLDGSISTMSISAPSDQAVPRRRRPPPPPSSTGSCSPSISRPSTPFASSFSTTTSDVICILPPSPAPSLRRAAPLPPRNR